MPDEPLRVFLSYGVRDASDVAERLHRNLAGQYQIWQDIHRIRIGWPWDEEVRAGLRNAQVMLALLSPQSVRRALDASNSTATDSVCLDEIAYARGSCRIPIVPVQVAPCEAPFLIYRLHQIDFRRWAESEAAYQAGLDRICAAIIEAVQTGKSPERPWRALLEPWDFTTFLLEKRKNFTGRQWLFRELDEWRSKQTPPALLITGEPGIGKSAIVAALVHENPDGQVLAYHCCRADTPATLDPTRFIRSLAAMLSMRVESFAAMLDAPAIKEALNLADTDPASAFEGAILKPLRKVPKPDGNRHYLLIDALDEALTLPKRPTIVDVLAARINQLPPWLGIVATTRSEPGVLRQLGGLPAQALKADDAKNQDDVRAFLQSRLSEPGLRTKVGASGKTLEELATSLLRSSAGNFLFVITAIDAVEGSPLHFDEIEKQPPGRLSSLYEMFFNRLFRDAGIDFESAGQVLEVVAAAREPLTRKQIAAVTGLDAEKQLPPLFGRLAAFVPVREGRYSLFHRVLFEWLTGWDNQQDQPFAGPYHLSLEDGHKRLAKWTWAEYRSGIQNVSPYCLRYLVTHLHKADQNSESRTVLLDFDWLLAKVAALDTYALIEDYNDLPKETDLRIVQSVLCQAAHILAGNPRELPGQLIGRLHGNLAGDIEALHRQASQHKGFPWLRPLGPSLIPLDASLVRTLAGHTGWVTAMAVTPDGSRIVSGSDDKTLRVWDLVTGEDTQTLQGHTGTVYAVAVTPDGRQVLSGSQDHTLRVWDLATGETTQTLQGHTGSVYAVAVTPDGRQVLSGSQDRTLRVWDLATGETTQTLQGHNNLVYALRATPDGRCVVSGSWDRTLRVWDLATGETIQTLHGHNGSVYAVAVTPNGRYVVSGSDDRTLRVWDLATGETKRTFQGHTGSVYAVAVTPDGRQVLSGSQDRTLRVWDLATGETKRTLQGHNKSVCAVTVTPDGPYVVSGSWDRTLRVWDLAAGETKRTLLGHNVSVSALTVTPDGCQVLSGSKDHTLRVWNLTTGKTTKTLQGHTNSVSAVAVTPDGRYVVSGSWDNTLRVWELATGETKRTLRGHTHWVSAVAVTADVGRYVVSGSWDQTLRVWDLDTWEIRKTLQGHTNPVTAVAVTPDGRYVVSGSWDGTLRIWDPVTGETKRTFKGHTGWISALAATPDGRHVVSGSKDRTLQVWDLATGETTKTLQGHNGWVTAAGITPDGRYVVSGSEDNTLRVWDLKDGEGPVTFTVDAKVTTCGAARDSRTIVAGDGFGRVHFLRLEGVD